MCWILIDIIPYNKYFYENCFLIERYHQNHQAVMIATVMKGLIKILIKGRLHHRLPATDKRHILPS